ncbi:hypothetical protein SAMN05444679_1478 [Variovorax sp. CF079]|uniref:DUF2272 domain-containing protein n=1 Tax=Variovorax sp. CF079 TaxID=1882774 RepID=UPI00088E0CDE|nr:DUF2272 domain-containing protein [Variovorax sp. CF079]SDE96961.1 hypothetical protein SAMN05444679_1478 [Variovorax sp. CF079]
MQKLVNVEAINVRSEARVEPDTLIGPIFLGQAVDDLEDGPEGWHHVRTAVDGKSTEGFVKAALPITKFDWQPPEQPTLRDPASPAREALVAAAVEQWLRFDRGAGKEAKEPFSGFIGEMWKAFGKPFTGKTATQPWSAVAISLMVRTAAREFDEYKSFQQSIGHAAYMWDAIKKNASGDLAAPFWGVRLDKAKPRVGDIIGSWRERPASYDDYLNASNNPELPSHCDIVVAVGPEVAWAIGGNVQNSVFATGYQLSSDGTLLSNPRITADGKLVGEAIVLLDNRVSS